MPRTRTRAERIECCVSRGPYGLGSWAWRLGYVFLLVHDHDSTVYHTDQARATVYNCFACSL